MLTTLTIHDTNSRSCERMSQKCPVYWAVHQHEPDPNYPYYPTPHRSRSQGEEPDCHLGPPWRRPREALSHRERRNPGEIHERRGGGAAERYTSQVSVRRGRALGRPGHTTGVYSGLRPHGLIPSQSRGVFAFYRSFRGCAGAQVLEAKVARGTVIGAPRA